MNNSSDTQELELFINHDLLNFKLTLESLLQEVKDNSLVNEEHIRIVKEETDQILKKAYEISLRLDSNLEIKELKNVFREKVAYLSHLSEIVNRGFTKPRGYPGDFELLEIIYDKKIITEKGLGRCYDFYFQNSPYAISIRARKDMMREEIQSIINNSNKEEINVLNLACGPSREIKELLGAKQIDFKNKKINFKLVDFDQGALDFSRGALSEYFSDQLNFEFIKENVLRLHSNKDKFIERWGSQDLVYSIGLIDYFQDRMLSSFIKFGYEILNEDGQLILSIKDETRDPYAPLAPNWFCNWEFVSRDEAYMYKLMKDLNLNMKISSKLDKTEKIVFFNIRK